MEINKLSTPFDSPDPFVEQWLQLEPPLGDVDLRPLLHLSRDADTRDFGVDELTAVGRALRDALAAATAANAPLSENIFKAGQIQAGLAMARAWNLQSSKRTWAGAADVLVLIETCKVFPHHGALAAELLSTAPPGSVGAGMVPVLSNQLWAKPVLASWAAHADSSPRLKRALEQMDKRGN